VSAHLAHSCSAFDVDAQFDAECLSDGLDLHMVAFAKTRAAEFVQLMSSAACVSTLIKLKQTLFFSLARFLSRMRSSGPRFHARSGEELGKAG